MQEVARNDITSLNVAAIAAEWGLLWQDLMPFASGAFVLFGLGSLPAGRLGDLWGRRAMMVLTRR